MKIKITESQAKFLKLIKEDADVSKQANELEKISKQLDKIYSHVSTVSVGEILDNSFDIDKIYDLVNHIGNLNHEVRTQIHNIYMDVDAGENDETMKTHDFIDNLSSKVNKKVEMLDAVVSALRRIKDDNDSELFDSNTIKIS
jgi:ferritin